MSKPWMEEWRAGAIEDNSESYDCVYVQTADGDTRLEASSWRSQSEEGMEAVAKLAAAAPALVRALLAVEWVQDHMDPQYRCANPECGQEREEPHCAGCSLDAALTSAGLLDQASRDEARAEIARMAK